MLAEDVELTKPSMESLVNATLAITETTMETASRATLFPSAMNMKDMMPQSRLAFVLMELSLSEENVRKFLTVLPILTITPSAVSVVQDISSTKRRDVSQSMLSSLNAQLTHSSTVSHALVILESSSKNLTLVQLVLQELNGTDRSVTTFLLRPVLLDMSSTKTSTNVNLQLLHVETMLTSMELPASA